VSERTTFRGGHLSFKLRTFNALGRLCSRIGLKPRPLSAERLLAAAKRRTGVEETGEGDLAGSLAALTEAFEREARMTPFGRISVGLVIRLALTNRLGLIGLGRRHPKISGERIERPVFIVGFPRTGTSLLFNLMAQAGDARPLLGWEAYHPLPPRGRRDGRIRKHRKIIQRFRRLRPELWEVHPLEVEGPEECLPLLLRSFDTDAWHLYGRIPSFAERVWNAPKEVHQAVYRFHRFQLQVLQWQRPGGRWLLKSPAHINTLQSLLSVYPDALVVRTHRDLAQVLPSTCSLFGITRSIHSDGVDLAELGREGLEMARRSISRQIKPLPDDLASRVAEVRYEELVRDPLGVVERIHAGFGLPFEPGMREAMGRWMEEHPRDRHGKHRYTLEQFSLDSAEVDAVAAPYRERFGVKAEGSA
jgi:hypothetical protein